MERCEPGRLLVALLLGVSAAVSVPRAQADDRVIEVIADGDNRFKVPGRKKPVITLKAGETVRLRITSRKGNEWNKDGTVHSFTIVELKDEGWDLLIKEGTQEFTVKAPTDPGEYKVECTVKCGRGHNQMRMKMIVIP
jgi:heme/copper-type cytochrome/quinol oxidase subunit 2